MRLLTPLLRPAARLFTGLLAVFISFWGMSMTTELWGVFALIAMAGVINFVIGVFDEVHSYKTQRQLNDILERLPAIPVTPTHVQNLQSLTSSDLKRAVAELTTSMRQFEHNSRAGSPQRRMPAFGSQNREEAHRQFMEDSAASIAYHEQVQAAFNEQFRPLALAYRDEMRRRLGLLNQADQARVPGHIALDIGMLAGVNPVGDAANQLEQLARQLP